MNDYSLFIGIGCFLAGLLIAFWLKGKIASQKVKAAEEEAARVVEEAQKKAETLTKEAGTACMAESTCANRQPTSPASRPRWRPEPSP